MRATLRLYLEDPHRVEADATIVALREDLLAFDCSVFYPGGGGQPHDLGTVVFPGGASLEIRSVQADAHGVIWHGFAGPLPELAEGSLARLRLDAPRRNALTRYHTVLHVLNTIALRDYGAWITGAQIATGYARIDFKLEGLSAAMCADIERKVNAELDAKRRLKAYYIPAQEFEARKDLLRTLDAMPPVIDGRVRVVEIDGFDAQACGGTHVDHTGELGRFGIFRTENKGRINKRLYVRLDAVPAR